MALRNLNKKAKTKWILEVVVKCHRKNGLFLPNLQSGIFFGGGEGRGKKKERLIYLLHKTVICHPLIKVSVKICVIMSDFTGNSSGLQKGSYYRNVFSYFPGKRWMLSWYGSCLQKHPRFLKSKLVLLLLRILPYHCCVIPLFKLSSQTNY